MSKPIIPRIFRKTDLQKYQEIENDLIRHEAKLTKHIFGAIPKGHHREFFCLDKNTWIWHEEWDDQSGNRKVVSTKYLIRPQSVLKSQNGGDYKTLDKDETKNLYHAIKQYAELVLGEYERIK